MKVKIIAYLALPILMGLTTISYADDKTVNIALYNKTSLEYDAILLQVPGQFQFPGLYLPMPYILL